MKGISPRFSAPLDVPRPRGGRLIEGFSPKLGRLVRLFDHAVVAQWIALEADSLVTAFCERPSRVDDKSDSRVIDFWVQRGERQEMLLLDDCQAHPDLTGTRVHGIELRVVPPAELAADAIWVANWQRMLPVITASRCLQRDALVPSVVKLVTVPMPLSRIEREFAGSDIGVVRGAIFEAVRTGRLGSSALRTQPLSLHIMLEPGP